MSSYLLDANVLLIAANFDAPENTVVNSAITALQLAEDDVFIAPQIAAEFWSVATRRGPKGLNWSAEFAASSLNRYTQVTFHWLQDPPDLYEEWLRLCTSQNIVGPHCFDARIVALMRIYGIDRILTFNAKHFSGFPNINAVNPADI